MKLKLALVLAIFAFHHGEALECYACNNESSGGACEFDPASTGVTTTCNEKYDYCFTRRIEEDGRNTAEIYRGCCRVETNSPTCPEGPDYQVKTENIYTYYFTRCQGDFCNDSDGLQDGTEENGGALIVDGVPEDYDYFNKDEGIVNGVDEDDVGSNGVRSDVSALVCIAPTVLSITLAMTRH